MSERKLSTYYPSWIHAFRDWTVPRSEAPESFIMWAGFYTLASVLKRNVRMPARLMGSYEIYPNLYVLFVGPPGGPRKSTTITYAKTLLQEVPNVYIASTATSASKLINLMDKNTDGTLSIMSSEFGSFVGVSEDAMYDVLTDIFDNRDKYVYTTRKHGTEVVAQPTINLLAATTPSWINEHMPPYVIGGGFASRTIFIYEPAPRRRKMYYDDLDDSEFMLSPSERGFSTDELGQKLLADLIRISELEGEFQHESSDLKDDMEEWYVEEVGEPAGDTRMENYLSRKHLHVHKVAMLLSVARDSSLTITRADFDVARELLSRIEERMPRVFSSVGKNPHSSTLDNVREYIQRKNGVTYRSLLSRFYHELRNGKDEMNEIVGALIAMGYVEKEQKGGNEDGFIYKPSE